MTFVRPTQENTHEFRLSSIHGISGNAFNPRQLRRMGGEISSCHRMQMTHSSLSEANKVAHGAMGSQQLMTTSRRSEDDALRGIGAQFEDQEPSHHRANLNDHTISDADRHHYHQASLNRMDMSCGVIQVPRCPGLRPMDRFLLENYAQQAAVFVEPCNNQPSDRGRCWHCSSPSRTWPQMHGLALSFPSSSKAQQNRRGCGFCVV
jgi:hypothetical protein